MNLLRIAFAIILGVLSTAIMEWLTTAPHGIDVLVGVVVAFLCYFGYPTFVGPTRPAL